jgi:excisionase family DNA binding protein
MRHPPSQLGARENRKSTRQHAARSARPSITDSSASGSPILQGGVSSSQESLTTLPDKAVHITATDGREERVNHLLTVREVAELLRVPVSWVYERTRRRGDGQLPHLKLGKYLRFEESSVTEFIREQRRA